MTTTTVLQSRGKSVHFLPQPQDKKSASSNGNALSSLSRRPAKTNNTKTKAKMTRRKRRAVEKIA